MKALSLRQPWAALVVYYGKNIENRRWSTRHRGPFLVHAARGMTRREFDEAYDFAVEVLGDGAPREAELRAMLTFGGIIGAARLVDVLPPCGSLFACQHDWHMPEQHGFVLEDVRAVPFVPWRGELGFFEVPDDYATRAA